jgi:hypothetical protein
MIVFEDLSMHLAGLILTSFMLSSTAASDDTPRGFSGITATGYESMKEDLTELNPSTSKKLAFLGVNSGMASVAWSMNLSADLEFGRKFFCIPAGTDFDVDLVESLMSFELGRYNSGIFRNHDKDEVPAGMLFLTGLMRQFPCN